MGFVALFVQVTKLCHDSLLGSKSELGRLVRKTVIAWC